MNTSIISGSDCLCPLIWGAAALLSNVTWDCSGAHCSTLPSKFWVKEMVCTTLIMQNSCSRDSVSSFSLHSQRSNTAASLFKMAKGNRSNHGNHLKFRLCLLPISDTDNDNFLLFLPESFCFSSLAHSNVSFLFLYWRSISPVGTRSSCCRCYQIKMMVPAMKSPQYMYQTRQSIRSGRKQDNTSCCICIFTGDN